MNIVNMEATLEKKQVKKDPKGQIETDFFKILIVGASGRGKTYGFRNMPESNTGFINAENKPLPFKKNFKFHARPKGYSGFIKAFEDFSANPEIDCIAVDSFSAGIDMNLEEMRAKYKGYDIWSNYNIRVSDFFKLVKSAKKEVIVTTHYEILDIEGDAEKRAKIKGKEWESMVEKEFSIVLYADNKFKDNKPSYFYQTVGENISAKCPPGIFEEDPITVDNDAYEVLKAVRNFSL